MSSNKKKYFYVGKYEMGPYNKYKWANFKNANLSNADLDACNFTCADLESSILIDAYLYGCCFIGADMKDANLSDACMIKADMRFSDLESAKLNNARLSYGPSRYNPPGGGPEIWDFTNTIPTVDFRGANLTHCDFTGVYFGPQGPDFYDFIGCNGLKSAFFDPGVKELIIDGIESLKGSDQYIKKLSYLIAYSKQIEMPYSITARLEFEFKSLTN